MSIILRKYFYRNAECILTSKNDTYSELDNILVSLGDISELSRPVLNERISHNFKDMGWKKNAQLLDSPNEGIMRIDYIKNRIQVEIESGHPSFIGTDLLKFQLASYAVNNYADVGVYVVPTERFMDTIISKHNKKWTGSITYEKATRSIDSFKSVIQCPIAVVGLDSK